MADYNTALLVASAVKAMTGPEPVGGTKAEYDEYNAAMHSATLEVLDAASEFGFVGTLMSRLDESVAFVADEVVSVTPEKTSKRYVITVKTYDKTKKEYKEEALRTNRTGDWRYGSAAKALGAKAKQLIGHRVAITKRNEAMSDSSNQKVRIVENIRDLGEARD